ncbi:menaquinone biosynthesis protein [Persephonella sp.]|uniref:menaquinone biosynthetic enzyme MqnA/MqnD family protein n=1 Tax=Persephonella sp. TaxID=2060922 RepID=UPI0025ED88B2|nr:menaquinone biosynthesis protein [Persephonella sp.]
MRIGWIDYLNTLPFNFEKTGIDLGFSHELVKGFPSQINRLLSEKKVDVGFISSVHYIQNFNDFLILPDLSISSLNKVKSVVILSEKPLEKTTQIYLTEESKTSQYLTKVIFEIFLGKNPVYKQLLDEDIKNKETVLLIGDKAIKFSNKKNYRYDLSEIWFKKTGLPFVFALWCVRKDYYEKNKEKVKKLNHVLKTSKNRFFENPEKYIKDQFLINYLKNLDYCLSEEHIKSLKLFSNYLLEINLINEKPTFRFIEDKNETYNF